MAINKKLLMTDGGSSFWKPAPKKVLAKPAQQVKMPPPPAAAPAPPQASFWQPQAQQPRSTLPSNVPQQYRGLLNPNNPQPVSAGIGTSPRLPVQAFGFTNIAKKTVPIESLLVRYPAGPTKSGGNLSTPFLEADYQTFADLLRRQIAAKDVNPYTAAALGQEYTKPTNFSFDPTTSFGKRFIAEQGGITIPTYQEQREAEVKRKEAQKEQAAKDKRMAELVDYFTPMQDDNGNVIWQPAMGLDDYVKGVKDGTIYDPEDPNSVFTSPEHSYIGNDVDGTYDHSQGYGYGSPPSKTGKQPTQYVFTDMGDGQGTRFVSAMEYFRRQDRLMGGNQLIPMYTDQHDKDGNPLQDTYLWNNQRSAGQNITLQNKFWGKQAQEQMIFDRGGGAGVNHGMQPGFTPGFDWQMLPALTADFSGIEEAPAPTDTGWWGGGGGGGGGGYGYGGSGYAGRYGGYGRGYNNGGYYGNQYRDEANGFFNQLARWVI